MASKIIKRDGRIVTFDPERIKTAVRKSMVETGKFSEAKLEKVISYVLSTIEKNFTDKIPHVEEVQDIVELSLMKYDLYDVAKAYILYRKERERVRKEKSRILNKDYVDEVDKAFSLDSIRVIASRYLDKDKDGKIIESPKEMFQRVALAVVIPDLLHDSLVYSKKRGKVQKHEAFNPERHERKISMALAGRKIFFNKYHLERMKSLYDKLNREGKMKVAWSKFMKMLSSGEMGAYSKNLSEYYKIMVEKKFLPNSPTLFNAGKRLGQLSACFVLGIDDDIESIMECVREGAIIFKSGGGVGVNYSKLRPSGDIVATTSGIASGPTSFMRIMDVMTDVIKQGGKRRGANMGIMESWHPNINEFIRLKEKGDDYSNFNISVMFDRNFWDSYEGKKPYKLINPRSKMFSKKIEPNSLLNEVAYLAWENGDPGVLFKDNINRRNILKKAIGEINATNPCGEEPLYEYESCNLGSINLYYFVEEGKFDWKSYMETIRTATRFLDNVIDINKYPIKKIEKNTGRTRKIGLGLMGLADALFAMETTYNSEEGFRMMKKFTEFLTYYSMDESVEASRERGTFPVYKRSDYTKGEMPIEGYYHKGEWSLEWDKLAKKISKNGIRNAEVTTMPPTGSVSMIADTSSGIEPQFSLVYEKVVPIGSFYTVDWELNKKLKKWGMMADAFLKKIIENGGSIQGLEDFPEELKKVFVTSHDIPWWDHIRAQAEIGKWACAAVSKTINMPSWVKPSDVKKAYFVAYKTGCKGVTIYRDGSKSKQVIYLPESNGEHEKKFHSDNNTLSIIEKLGISVDDDVELMKTTEGIKESRNNHKKCPSCGNSFLKHEGGCVSCASCGWSECLIS
jgi:ribonucleoside-diphosphate reductase alpha chain